MTENHLMLYIQIHHLRLARFLSSSDTIVPNIRQAPSEGKLTLGWGSLTTSQCKPIFVFSCSHFPKFKITVHLRLRIADGLTVQTNFTKFKLTLGWGSPTASQCRATGSPSLATTERGGELMNGFPITGIREN